MSELIRLIESEYQEIKDKQPSFSPGDTIVVAYKIKEGTKERIQNFQGTVIQIKNTSTVGHTFTVRKVSGGIGVERVFPIVSPNIESIQVIRKGKVRRAKLYYLRGRQGKSARIKEKMR
jgi:large subunit ribosomal protein L19